MAWIALIVALVLAAWGVISRVHARATLAKEKLIPRPFHKSPRSARSQSGLRGSGAAGQREAFMKRPSMRATSGYLKTLVHGHRLARKKGTGLAEIDSRRLTSSLQAQAMLAPHTDHAAWPSRPMERWRGSRQRTGLHQTPNEGLDAAAKQPAEASLQPTSRDCVI